MSGSQKKQLVTYVNTFEVMMIDGNVRVVHIRDFIAVREETCNTASYPYVETSEQQLIDRIKNHDVVDGINYKYVVTYKLTKKRMYDKFTCERVINGHWFNRKVFWEIW